MDLNEFLIFIIINIKLVNLILYFLNNILINSIISTILIVNLFCFKSDEII